MDIFYPCPYRRKLSAPGAAVQALPLVARDAASRVLETAWCRPGEPGAIAQLPALQPLIHDLPGLGDDIYWLILLLVSRCFGDFVVGLLTSSDMKPYQLEKMSIDAQVSQNNYSLQYTNETY